jgi:hypothetical protein
VSMSDVQDAIDQMLGRDLEEHRPPQQSWDGLLGALRNAGVPTDEQELIATPLTVELSDDAAAEISND